VDTTIVPFLDARNRPYQYVAIRYDITERKRHEERLRETEALTRLGAMAAVVAHEVKNPIAGIRGALQVILSRLPADQRDRPVMGDIISRLDVLNGIVEDLLLYARPRPLRKQPVNLADMVTSTVSLLQRDPAFAAVAVQVTGQPDPVLVDPDQLRIAVQNVLINAAHAAAAGQGPIEVHLGAHNASAAIAVRDHGPGMSEEVRAKAFDAFFTTKHRGTGLGLPIARRIVEAHEGTIIASNPEGGGTVVTIVVPARHGDA